MGYMFIIGGERGWVMGHSTTGQVFGTVFETENEVKHFIGYWLTLFEANEWSDVYDDWFKKYYDEDEEFIGSIDEWNYDELSVEF